MAIPRQEILRRLRAQGEAGKPIIGCGAGTGISAKFAEAGGADLIIIYNSGRYRMAGRGSLAGYLPYGDANGIVVEMGAEVLPIVQDGNLCLDCHAVGGEKVEGEPAPLPESHRTDLRNDPTTVRDEVAGARYVCTSCHVPTNDVSPLVENHFGG